MINASLGIICDSPDGVQDTLLSGALFRDIVILTSPTSGVIAAYQEHVPQIVICPPHHPDWINSALAARSIYQWVVLLRGGERLNPLFVQKFNRIMEESAVQRCSALFTWTPNGWEQRIFNKMFRDGNTGRISVDVPLLVSEENEVFTV